MITRVEALRYRSLRYVALDLADFQILVGPNASGKSTFLDVIGFLGDLLRVGPRDAVMDAPRLGVRTRSKDARDLCFMGESTRFELAVELRIPAPRRELLPNDRFARARYEVAIEVDDPEFGIRIAAETLWLLPEAAPRADTGLPTLFPNPRPPPQRIVREPNKRSPRGWRKVVNKIGESGNDYFTAETSNWNNPFRLGPTRSALANLPEDESRFPVATWVKRTLMEGIQNVALTAEAIRSPSPPGSPKRFLPDGSNLPWVVADLRNDNDRFEHWVDHIRTALPDVADVSSVEYEHDRHRAVWITYANDLQVPSWLVSDGTLRLLALTLLAYVPDSEGIILIEEPENGIHPRAVETVFQSLSGVHGTQVLCATHSGVILSMAKPEDILCFAKDRRGATDVVRGSEHPRLSEWRGALDLGTLFASGVSANCRRTSAYVGAKMRASDV